MSTSQYLDLGYKCLINNLELPEETEMSHSCCTQILKRFKETIRKKLKNCIPHVDFLLGSLSRMILRMTLVELNIVFEVTVSIL